MRKILLSLLAVFLLVGVCAAEEPLVVVTIDSHVPVYEYAAKVFEERYGIPVQLVSQAYDKTHEVIVTAAVGRSSGFDVVAIDTIYVSNYALAGIVEPLTNFARPSSSLSTPLLRWICSPTMGCPTLGGGYNYKYFYYNEKLLGALASKLPSHLG